MAHQKRTGWVQMGSPWAMVPASPVPATATLGFGASSAVEAQHCGGCWGSARRRRSGQLVGLGPFTGPLLFVPACR
jgi:hypothetical protein